MIPQQPAIHDSFKTPTKLSPQQQFLKTLLQYPQNSVQARCDFLQPKSSSELLNVTQQQIMDQFVLLESAEVDQDVYDMSHVEDNRYIDVFPYQHSQVKVFEVDDFYVNANHVRSITNGEVYAIFSQAPYNSYDSFWETIYYKNVRIIFMLCLLDDPQRGPQASQYWPNLNQSQNFSQGLLSVTNTSQSKLCNEILETEFTIEGTYGPRKVKHLHWAGWLDLQKPAIAQIQQLDYLVDLCVQEVDQQGVPLIHCSAGIGRTGTFGGIVEALRFFRSNTRISIFRIVENLRKYRCHAVQSYEQYKFLYELSITDSSEELQTTMLSSRDQLPCLGQLYVIQQRQIQFIFKMSRNNRRSSRSMSSCESFGNSVISVEPHEQPAQNAKTDYEEIQRKYILPVYHSLQAISENKRNLPDFSNVHEWKSSLKKAIGKLRSHCRQVEERFCELQRIQASKIQELMDAKSSLEEELKYMESCSNKKIMDLCTQHGRKQQQYKEILSKFVQSLQNAQKNWARTYALLTSKFKHIEKFIRNNRIIDEQNREVYHKIIAFCDEIYNEEDDESFRSMNLSGDADAVRGNSRRNTIDISVISQTDHGPEESQFESCLIRMICWDFFTVKNQEIIKQLISILSKMENPEEIINDSIFPVLIERFKLHLYLERQPHFNRVSNNMDISLCESPSAFDREKNPKQELRK